MTPVDVLRQRAETPDERHPEWTSIYRADLLLLLDVVQAAQTKQEAETAYANAIRTGRSWTAKRDLGLSLTDATERYSQALARLTGPAAVEETTP